MDEQTQPKITLYGPRETPYTLKVMRALQWKGLPYELVEPTRREDFRRWNPEKALLPVIDVDGTRVDDSVAILDLLEERFPEPPLLSRDPLVAAEQRRIETWVAETFFFYAFRAARSRLGDEAAPSGDAAGPSGPMASSGLLQEDGSPRPEFFETGPEGLGEEFPRRMADLSAMLGDRDFFQSDELSRADLGVFAMLWAMYENRYTGSRALLATHPNLEAHTERVDALTRVTD